MTHASVFSGIGGPEVAATMLGWDNLFHCEINPFGRAVLDYWYPNSKSYEDITKTDFTEWRGRVNVLTGGFPCQPFSYAGQRRGATDDRYLWPYMFRCIDQVRPDWVVAENVAGILTMVEQGEVSEVASQGTLFDEGDGLRGYRLRETFTLQRICDDLESHGYAVQPVLIPACGVGAPHKRDRVFIVGRRKDTADTDNDGLQYDAGRGEQAAMFGTQGKGGQDGLSEQVQRIAATGTGEPTADAEVRPHARPACSGAGTPRPGGEAERGGSDANQQPSERRTASERHHGLSSVPRHAADTDGDRGREVDEHMEPQLADGAEPFGNGGQRHAADTDNTRLEGRDKPRSEEAREWLHLRGHLAGHSDEGGEEREYHCGDRWANFPSVSPVHRGNDGIPFPVDCLTIPFSKWRTEALKAYGNAIVPQVMYEIFRAIEAVETYGREG